MKKILHFIALASFPLLALSAEPEIKIPREIPYKDESMVQEKIVSECKTLGVDFSQFLAKALTENGFSPTVVDVLDTANGVALDVSITNIYSHGNAFIGHMKSASALVKVYKDGKETTTKKFSRDTRGGFGAGFKGSCDVLNRATNAVSEDIAKWYKKQN